MATLQRTDASNEDFLELVKLLDTDLQLRDGEEHYFFAQFNTTEGIKYVVVAYEGEEAVGCGAMRHFSDGVMELKRMFVRQDYRGRGIASQILQELENWTLELGYMRCILETGRKQPEAIALYKKHLYQEIENFGPYKGVESSMCFEKVFVSG
ncbi:MAG TPA: GNAT family N-acetyltransferase [Flavobacterium sp.]|jgi:GNAT superfamily N-acetyltransferase